MSKKILTVTLNPAIDETIEIEKFIYGGLNRVKSIRRDVGGKGINVAKVLREFGADVSACGFIAGSKGQEIVSYLNKENIPCFFTEVKGETRTNRKIIDLDSGITTEINENGFTVDSNELKSFVDTLTDKLPEFEVLVLAGSVPKDVDDSIYKDLIEIANKNNVKVILDADGEKFKQGLLAKPYAIKPNLFEFEQLFGKKMDNNEAIIESANKVCSDGVSITAISMGGDGALFVDNSDAYSAIPFEIECKCTVAAGDSMVATMAYAIVEDWDLEKVARYATTAGTITASKEGTNVCNFSEVTENAPLVKLNKLN